MRVLFISTNQEKKPVPVIPFGMCYVAGAVRTAGHKIQVCDLMFEQDFRQALSRSISDFDPEILAVSVRNTDNQDFFNLKFYLPQVKEVVDYCKRISSAKIVMGGAGFSSKPEAMLRFLDLEIGIIGEGELTLRQLINKMDQPHEVENIPGLGLLKNGKFIRTGPCWPQSLDQLAPPAIDLIDYNKYYQDYGYGSIQTKRGCSFDCLYCQILDYHGRNERCRSPKNIVNDIETLVKTYGIEYFYFTDNLFNHPKGHAEAICKEIIARKLSVQWTSYFHPGFVGEDFLLLLKAAGCGEILFNTGTISMTEKAHRTIDLETLHKSITDCKKVGMKFTHFLFFGAPGEDFPLLKKTFAVIEEMEEPDQFFILYQIPIFPGARLAELAKREIGITEIPIEPLFYTSPKASKEVIDYIQEQCTNHPNWHYKLVEEYLG